MSADTVKETKYEIHAQEQASPVDGCACVDATETGIRLIVHLPDYQSHTFDWQGEHLLDGKPFQIISGDMHYARARRLGRDSRLTPVRAVYKTDMFLWLGFVSFFVSRIADTGSSLM